MLKNKTYISSHFVFLILITSILIPYALYAGETDIQSKPGSVFFRDDFTGTSLRPEWILLNADNERFSLETGKLIIISSDREKGVKNEISFTKNMPGNYEVTLKIDTRLESDATVRMNIKRDNDNLLSLIRTRQTNEYQQHALAFRKTLRGESSEVVKRFQQLPREIYLKIVKSEIEYTAYYSFDGTTWSEIGQQFFKGLDGRPSLDAYNWKPKVPEVAVQFDYFEIKVLE